MNVTTKGQFYIENNKQYPRVTSVLNVISKGKRFDDWLKANGDMCELIAQQAADRGTRTHDVAEKLILGKKVEWNEDINLHVKAFQDWHKTIDIKDIIVESYLRSKKYCYAGRCDLICSLNGKRTMLDYKTSGMIHKTYYLQMAAYRCAYEEITGDKIEQSIILHLKKDGTYKECYIQDYKKDFNSFLACLVLWRYVNG